MTPLLTVSISPGSHSSSSSTTSHIDRPERSRNAKAQARHRAKRKAYIEQLEQTVTRLQYALSLAPDQMVAVPPAPQMRIRELEEENMHLTRQVEHLRHQLEARNARLRPDNGQRSATLPTFDDRMADRDVVRRRRTVEESDDLYMTSGSSRMSNPQLVLSIPAEDPQYPPHSSPPYPASQTTMDYEQSPQSSGAPSYGLSYQYQMPETPSSSTTSSPTTSFSSGDLYSPSMQSQTCVHVSSSSHVTQHPYARGPNQYNNVKIEEDVYQISQGIPQPTAYSTLSHTFGGSQSAVSHWHTYPEHA